MNAKHPAVCVVLAFLAGASIACGVTLPIPDGETPTAALPPSATAVTPAATSVPPATMPAEFDKWTLWTSGTQLRGANIYQRRIYPELDGTGFMGPGPIGPPYVQKDFDRLAALGANYVNISHPGLFTEKPPYTLDKDVQENLDRLLEMIARADMFAVISFRTGPGRAEFSVCCLEDVGDWYTKAYLNDTVWQDKSTQDAWVEMWRYTAQHYRDNPIVVGYDLMVEPNANEVWLDLWDPEEFRDEYGGTLYDWNQLYPRITTAIREADATTPLLVGGMGYSGIDWLPILEPTGDPYTVYTVHQYAPHVYTHQWWEDVAFEYPGTFDTDWDGEDDRFDRAWLEDLLSAADEFATAHGVPVAMNEFGVARWAPGAARFMDDQMGLFEQQGWNYALWAWEPEWEPWAEEVDGFNFRFGSDHNNHTEVSNDLMDVIVRYWERNTVRPSSLGASAPDSTGSASLAPADIAHRADQMQDLRRTRLTTARSSSARNNAAAPR